MLAILKDDIITRLIAMPREHEKSEGVEIGNIPNGAGLERLRYDVKKKKLIDLYYLNRIYVRYIDGRFELHAVKVPGVQYLSMTWKDRKRLGILPNGKIYLKTDRQIEEEKTEEKYKTLAKNIVAKVKKKSGANGFELELLLLISAIIYYARRRPAKLEDYFDKLIEKYIGRLSYPDRAMLMVEKMFEHFANEIKKMKE